MYLRYVLACLLVLASKVIVYAFAFAIAMCIRYYPEDVYPVATKFGIKRPHTVPWLRWTQTFDDSLDSYWRWLKKSAWLRKWFSEEYYNSHAWLRWFTRVLWLWRNNSYGLAYALGFDQRGLSIVKDDDPNDKIWDQEKPCRLLRTFTNIYRQKGFLYRARYKLPFGLYYEVVLGYKVPWSNYSKAMLASRIFKIGKF